MKAATICIYRFITCICGQKVKYERKQWSISNALSINVDILLIWILETVHLVHSA